MIFPQLRVLRLDSFRGQISEHIFASNGGHCLYVSALTFCFKTKEQNSSIWKKREREVNNFQLDITNASVRNWFKGEKNSPFGAKICSDICPRN